MGQPGKNCREEFVGRGAGHRSRRPIAPREAGCSEGLLEGGSHLGVGDGEGDLIGRDFPRQPSQPADHRLSLAIGIVNDLDLLQRHRDRSRQPGLAHEAPQRIEAGGKILRAQVGRGGDEGLKRASGQGEHLPLQRIDIDCGQQHQRPREMDLTLGNRHAAGRLAIPDLERVELGEIRPFEPGQRLPAGVVAKAGQGHFGLGGDIGKAEGAGGQFAVHPHQRAGGFDEPGL